jgi:peptidoglycan/LPS O-acetylase OafA/YrhL
VVPKLGYRPDVDGLRTIAVLPVVLFHFGFAAFSGGFVGVDVFFVISGYLITRLILHEIEQGTFSFARFYERRARRLFPAMFVTVVASLLAGQFLLFTEYLTQAAGSAILAVTSLSNVVFWTQSGYFDTEALTKPLLHTWSLSVEEQFYLVWPAALVLLMPRFGRAGVLIVLALAGSLSLLAAEYVMRSDISAAFYLTPFRIVEFALGAAVLGVEHFVEKRRWLLEACLLAGLVLIFYAVFTYSDETVFPGLAALVPCLGTALAIAGGRAPVLGLVLRNPVCVWIGLISYSIYLVHWPLAVYFDAYFFRDPAFMEQLALLGLTLILAALMYRFIETPYRKGPRRLSAPAFGLACALLALLVVVPASVQWSSRHASDDFASSVRGIMSIPLGLLGATPAYGQEVSLIGDDAIGEIAGQRRSLLGCNPKNVQCGAPKAGKRNVIIIGDSTSIDAFNIFTTAFPENNYILLHVSGCAPWETGQADGEDCTAANATRDAAMADLQEIKDVVLMVNARDDRVTPMKAYLAQLYDEGRRAIVIGQIPSYRRKVPDIYRRIASAANPRPSLAEAYDLPMFTHDAELKRATEAFGGVYIPRSDFYCPNGQCRDYTLDNTIFNIADRMHVTLQSAVEFGDYVRANYPGLFAP